MPLLQVCVWVCVSVSAVIDTSDSIEYDSQRLSFNTHATARHVPLTHAQSSSLSQYDGNGQQQQRASLGSYFNRRGGNVYAGILV